MIDSDFFHPLALHKILYLRCPECEFETKEENNFEDHAIKNHPMSFELFRKKSVKEECEHCQKRIR